MAAEISFLLRRESSVLVCEIRIFWIESTRIYSSSVLAASYKFLRFYPYRHRIPKQRAVSLFQLFAFILN